MYCRSPASLPETADPERMRSNAEVDFEISEMDLDALRTRDYGQRRDGEHGVLGQR